MKIIDSNLLIYSAQEEFVHLRELFQSSDIYISTISKVEVLGFHKLTPSDKIYFDALFRQLKRISISDDVIEKATILRQQHKLSLGDAIIAATTIIYDATLLTRNTSDFVRIKGISVNNPM